MKIAVDLRSAGGEKAGKGWYTFFLLQNLLKRDKENDYILYANAGVPGFEEFKNAKLKIISKKGILWHLSVMRNLKKESVDLFFAPSSYIIPAFLTKKIKTIVTVHDLVALLFPQGHNKKAVWIEKMLLNRLVKRSDKILTVSKNTKKDLLSKFDCEEKKVEVIYCGASDKYLAINKIEFKDFIDKTNLPEKFFLAVGTLIPRKNYLRILKAFLSFSKKYEDYHLVIVGNKGWQYKEIFAFVKSNYLRKKVHFLDYVSEKSLIGLYNLAKGLVLPSLYEGFGIPPLEAMQCGCPVICSNRSSLPELVEDAGILIDPENVDKIEDSMIRLVKNKELIEELRKKGFEQAKKFSWNKSAEKLFELIKNLEKI